jgi:SAM-dependent methyltransferase
MKNPSVPKAKWPLQLPPDTPQEIVDEIRQHVEELASSAQYGWGHSINFGRFEKEGILGEGYLEIAGALDSWAWWPEDLTGQVVADVGCFTGGLSLYLAARNPSVVYAVDELPGHLAQCAYLAEVFQMKCIISVQSSVFFLLEHLPENALDLVLLSGVLYHLSDMLVGLYVMRCLLKPGGTLLIESNAVNDFTHSYANFGRFYAGMWWQPSGLCIQDMCDFMGFEDTEVRFYKADRCLVRTIRSDKDIPFKRGMHWRFDSLRDARPRPMDQGVMAPVKALPQRWQIPSRAIGKLLRIFARRAEAQQKDAGDT